MVQTQIPYEYIRKHISLDWGEALWALNNGFLFTHSMAEVAADRLARGSEDWREVEIINLVKHDTEGLFELVKQLASEDVTPNEIYLKEKWTYFFVKWNFETYTFDEFYRKIFEYYFENGKPKMLETVLNFQSPNAMTVEKQRRQTKKLTERFIKKSGEPYLS